MLLSVKPPSLTNGIKSLHEYSNHNLNPSRYSPPESPRALPSFDTSDARMNNQHRGLPPPMGMTLPPPDRGLPAMAPLGNLPAPPAQWTGADESMRNWLQAKAEEDRRRQEEERTRQEGLRLDQRKIEQSMLRESLSGGVPPTMVPLIFAGMGSGSLSPQTLEWAQHYMAQLTLQTQQQQQVQQHQHQHQQQHQIQAQQQQVQQQQIQQQQHMSPDIRRDTRMIPPNPYGGHQPLQPALASSTTQPNQQLPPQPPQTSLARQAPPPTSMPRNTSSAGLSRLNTVDHIPNQQISTAPVGSQSLHPLQQSQPTQQQEPQQSSAPGLFFHHWTPTAASTKSGQPPTPSGKSAQGSPFSQSQNSHLRSEYQNSPKKRKAAGGHPVPQIPTSQPSDTSPPFSTRSSRERDMSPGSRNKGAGSGRRHSRHHSDASSNNRDADGRNLARPSSRQARLEGLSVAAAGGDDAGAPNRQHTDSSLSNASNTDGSEDRARFGGGGGGAGAETEEKPGPEMREHHHQHPLHHPAKREMEL